MYEQSPRLTYEEVRYRLRKHNIRVDADYLRHFMSHAVHWTAQTFDNHINELLKNRPEYFTITPGKI